MLTGYFDLQGFGDHPDNEKFGYHVANGIAYVPKSLALSNRMRCSRWRGQTFIVTGKNWNEPLAATADRWFGAGLGCLRSL